MKLTLENTTESRFIEWLKEEADSNHLKVDFLGDARDDSGQVILNTHWYQVRQIIPMCLSFDSEGYPSLHTLFGINCILHNHPKINLAEGPHFVPVPEGESYIIDLGTDADHSFNIFLEDKLNSILVDFIDFDWLAKDNLSFILDGITSEWTETKVIIDAEWFGVKDDNTFIRGKPGRKPKKMGDISKEIAAVVGWERVKHNTIFENYSEETFGLHPDGTLKMPKSTFYDIQKMVKEVLKKPD